MDETRARTTHIACVCESDFASFYFSVHFPFAQEIAACLRSNIM